MEMPAWLSQLPGTALAAWQSLDGEVRLIVWLALGVVGIAVWAGFAYVILRRLAGHRKFRSRWYRQAEYARLMQVLWEDQQAGLRVMSRQELKALREFRYGDSLKPILTGRGGGYFDV
jgi:hypothetical protein